MKITDELLMAYADGELDADARAEVEAAIAADPGLARAVARHRALAEKVRGAYRDVLDETVPARLSSLTAAPLSAPVVDIASIRAERAAAKAAAPSRWQLPQWSAMAAAVTLGLFVGAFALRGPGEPWEETAGGLVAKGDLDQALTSQLAGSVGTGGVRIGLSFRDRGGSACRTFRMERTAPVAGLACRAGDGWQLRVLAQAPVGGGELQAAGSMPLAVMQAVDAAIAGEALDAEAEAALRDSGWR